MLDALVYESHADPRLTDAELEVILIGSRVRNARRGITGALLKRDVRIVQMIEGPADEIDRTFAAIAASPFHRHVQVLRRASGLERIFDRWHMGFFDFQSLHVRGATTATWIDTLPELQAHAATNPVLATLLERWTEITSDVR
ncbi:BLUF domain-containing protein [Cognatilysobacter terrigena]|uniref:BLUF domain-containing protein n=1 Tax=Cognatilysobacter terrigena TaxID=2488749 RepID=UPI0014152FC0|nr:BLUF domain-containing protein [Lysobacter terrigena]